MRFLIAVVILIGLLVTSVPVEAQEPQPIYQWQFFGNVWWLPDVLFEPWVLAEELNGWPTLHGDIWHPIEDYPAGCLEHEVIDWPIVEMDGYSNPDFPTQNFLFYGVECKVLVGFTTAEGTFVEVAQTGETVAPQVYMILTLEIGGYSVCWHDEQIQHSCLVDLGYFSFEELETSSGNEPVLLTSYNGDEYAPGNGWLWLLPESNELLVQYQSPLEMTKTVQWVITIGSSPESRYYLEPIIG